MAAHFTASQAQALHEFLSESHRPENTLTYPRLAGFLFTICASPVTVEVDDWMSVIFDDHDPAYFNEKQDKQVQADLVALYQWIKQGIVQGQSSLPPLCEPQAGVLDNFAEDAGLSQWCQGFLIGHDWLSDVWDEPMTDEQDADLSDCMLALSFFASEELALEWQKELDDDPKPSLVELGQEQLDGLYDAMATYAALGRAIAPPAES